MVINVNDVSYQFTDLLFYLAPLYNPLADFSVMKSIFIADHFILAMIQLRFWVEYFPFANELLSLLFCLILIIFDRVYGFQADSELSKQKHSDFFNLSS